MCVFVRNYKILFLFVGLSFCNGFNASGQRDVSFIENKNQWQKEVHFSARIPGGKMLVGPTSFKYMVVDYEKLEALHHRGHDPRPDGSGGDDQQISGHAVFVDFVGADPSVPPQGLGKSKTYYNYFLGDDPSRWASEAYGYQGIFYESLYPEIDLKVYAAGENVKYDLIVAPNGDPSKIRVRYQGADDLILSNGNLVIATTLGNITEKSPVAWQHIDGERRAVPCIFQLEGNLLSFSFPKGFDSCYELVIDPLLIFSTYSGSTADNWGSTATPGERGNLYSSGVTQQSEGGFFPATPGAFQVTSGGFYDIGILKYDSAGSQLLYATYLGGSSAESPHSLVMNAANELILLGTTSSTDFATTTNAFDRSFNGGPSVGNVVGYTYNRGSDIIISRFSADGTTLLASTFLGGTENDGLNPLGGPLTKNYGDQLRGDIITDDVGNIYVSSVTSSTDFPGINGFGGSYLGGATDAVLFKIDSDLSQVIWASYLGGSGSDAAYTVKLDAAKNVFTAGGTTSSDFPVTTPAYQTEYAGEGDGWIAKIASDGSAILNATLTGTAEYNQVYFMDLNAEEEIYVYGQTSGVFPVTPGVYSNSGSGQFIQKFDNALGALEFSTVFGAGRGMPDISPTAFLVNECNNLYMAGWGGRVNSQSGYWNNAGTLGMTTTADAFQMTTSGSDFYFIVMTDDAKERLYATFFGGTQSSTHVDGGTSRFDKGGIVYHSVCSGCMYFNTTNKPTSDFPTTSHAWSRTNNSNNCNNAAFKFDLSSLKARLRTNSVDRDMPGLKVVCIPDAILFENRSTGGEIFNWDFGDGTLTSRTDTSFVIHYYKNPGQYLVRLEAIDQGTCQVVDITTTTVTVNFAESVVQDDADLCFGDDWRLQASGAVQYFWTAADSTFSSNDATPVVSPPDTTLYYVKMVESSGCVRKDTVQLNVVPKISPEFDWVRESDCLERPQIAVRNLTDSLRSADTMFFDFGDGTTSDLTENEHFFEKDGVYNIRLVTQREFCVFEESVSVPVFEIFIPNVITPGQPQHNDVFTVRFGQQEGVTPSDYGYKVALTIYNRWGRVVYQTDDYQYDWSGQSLAAGVYYYEVSIEGHTTCKSWLHLVK